MTSFRRKEVCDICPWRQDLDDTQRLPRAYVERMAESCAEGFNGVFLCRREPDAVCAGYLLSADSLNNFFVRKALRTKRFDPAEIITSAPLFPTYAELALANRIGVRRAPATWRMRGKSYVVRAAWPLQVSLRDWLAILSD